MTQKQKKPQKFKYVVTLSIETAAAVTKKAIKSAVKDALDACLCEDCLLGKPQSDHAHELVHSRIRTVDLD